MLLFPCRCLLPFAGDLQPRNEEALMAEKMRLRRKPFQSGSS
jgi:hypothetical protein